MCVCYCLVYLCFILLYSITLEVRLGTTDDLATTPIHLVLFLAALVEPAKSFHSYLLFSIVLQSLILSALFSFFSFTLSCRIVFAKPEDIETWPKLLSFCFLARVRSSLYSPMADWIFLRTPSFLTWSLYEISNSLQ